MAADGPAGEPQPAEIGGPVGYLASVLKTHLGVTITPETVGRMKFYMSQVGPSNQDDLASTIFLECMELSRVRPLTDAEVRLAADRVRQRLVREARKALTLGEIEERVAPELPADDEAEMILRDVQALIQSRPATDAILFQRYFIEGRRPVAELAKELGISTATAYRKLESLRRDFLAIRDLRQPPHAAD